MQACRRWTPPRSGCRRRPATRARCSEPGRRGAAASSTAHARWSSVDLPPRAFARAIRRTVEPESIPVYRQAFEVADAGLAVLSPQGEWRLANAALAAMTGQAPDALCGHRAHERVFDARIAEGIAAFLATPAGARPPRAVFETAPDQTGASAARAFRVSLVPLHDAGGALLLQCQ